MKSIISALRCAVGSMWLLMAVNAAAALPDSGWYFNQNESGRGFNIEIQNNVLFIAGFMYDSGGNQIWVYSGGPMSSDHTYSGAAYRTAGGQPLGGAYQAPANVPFGTATISWITTTTANITINGYFFTVTRQVFGFDQASTVQPLLGEFAFVHGTPTVPTYFGQRITFLSTQVLSGELFAVGAITGDSSRIAIGNYSSAVGKWLILLDSSTSYYQFYSLRFSGLNFVEGTVATYLKTDSPTGGLNAIGNRIKSAQAAVGADAPGTVLALHPSGDVRVENFYTSIVGVQHPQQLDPTEMDSLRMLQNALESVRKNNVKR